MGFEFDGTYIWIGTHDPEFFTKTLRYRNITGGNNRISIVIDDLQSVDPWRPRGIKFGGTAEVVEHQGRFGPGKYIRITPRVSMSWGLDRRPKDRGAPSSAFRALRRDS